MSIRDDFDRTAPMVDRLNDAIRENPLAAGLIGAGLAWMLLGAKGLGTVAGLAKDTAAGTAAAVGTAGGAAAAGLRSAGNAAASAAQSAASVVADKAASIVPDIDVAGPGRVSDAATDAASTLSDGLSSAISAGGEYSRVLKSRLSESLEQQPLLLGAIGLAIGAGIASSFATTKIESEWIGERGAQARDAITGVFDDVKDRAQEVLSDVQEEATRQGLTLDAAKEAVSSVASRVRNVAGDASDAAKKPFTAAREHS